MTRYMVHPFTSKHHILGMYDPGITIAHTATVIALGEWHEFAILQSGIHWAWALAYGNKLATRPQYSPTTCFDTFPFPETVCQELGLLGEAFHDRRLAIAIERNIGATAVHNMIDSARDRSPEVVELRSLISRIDDAVLASYGWNDIELSHDFYATPQGVRFTFTETAGLELLQRLLELNHRRYNDEVTRGFHIDSKKRNAIRTSHATVGVSQQMQLGFKSDATAIPRTAQTTAILDFLSTHSGWHAKADILAATGITDGQWNTTIADLIASKRIERQGERRGTRYRFVE